jgi:fused signal recognition particle receptor
VRVFERLKEGLARTRGRLSSGLSRTRASGEPDWESLEEALLGADVGVAAMSELMEAIRGQSAGGDVREILSRELMEVLNRAESARSPQPAASPQVILVVGVNGVGKTTTVARLSRRAVLAGRKPLMIAADTFRAAAVEQLETWAERLGVDLVRGREGADPAAVVHDGLQTAVARGVGEVLIDTAGRLHTKKPLMDELAKVKRIAGRVVENAPHQTLLVMDATVGSNGLAQARQFSDSLGVDGIVLTKLDGTARGGIVVAVARELGLPVRYAGIGEGEDDLMPFSAADFVAALLGSDGD